MKLKVKWNKRILSFMLAMLLPFSSIVSPLLVGNAAAADSSNFLNLYDNFESYAANATYALDDTTYGSAASSATVKEETTAGNQWLELSGNNMAMHKYAAEGWDRQDFSGKIADHDGVAVYIKTTASFELNLTFRAGYWGISRTAMNSDLDYTLVTKAGEQTTGKESGKVTIPENFEGWVVIGYSEITAAGGWSDALTGIQNNGQDDLKWINAFAVEVSNATSAVYVDNIAFVTDTEGFLACITDEEISPEPGPSPEPEPEPEPEDGPYNSGYLTADNGNILYFENFDSWTDEYNYVFDFTDMDPGKIPTYDVVTKSGSDRWLKINGYSVWGHRYADDGWMREGLEANIKDYSGFSMYVKNSDAATFNLIMAMGTTARFSTQTAAELTYTLISKTGNQMIAETKYGVGGITLPANFEGWIVLDKEQFAAPMGWPESVANWSNLPNGDVRYLNIFVPYVQTTGEFYLDNLGFVKDLDTFIDAHSDKTEVPLTPETAGNQIVLENFDKNPTNAYAEEERFILADRSSGNRWWTPTVADESGFSIINSPITPKIGFNGFSMYIETVKDVSFALFTNKSETSFRTTSKGKITYTLIETDGSYRDVSVNDGYLKIKAGFKGHLVIDKSMFQNAGWGQTDLTIQDVKASDLTMFYMFLSMGVDGKDTSWKMGIDDICFVQDVAKLRSDLTNGTYKNTVKEVGVAKGDEYSYLLEDFTEMPLGVLDLFYNGISNGNATEEGGIEIVSDAEGHKWWKQSKAGFTGFKTAYIAPKSVGTNWDGLALYVKVDMKEATDMSMSLGGVIHTQILNAFPNAKAPYTTANFSIQNQCITSSVAYTTIDTERNQQAYQNMGSIQFDKPFEGWVYVDKSVLTDTWLDNRPMDTIAAHMLDNFTFGFSQFNQGSVSIRELRLVTDMEGFFTQNAKPADLVYEFEYDEIEIIPAEDFQYIKENDINMHITITDGYPIYEWHFKGSEVDTPEDFNPEILFDDDIAEIDKKNELYGLLEDEVARAFLLNEMPGKATLFVTSDLKYEFEQELYLYKYDAKEGTSKKVSDDVYLVNEADMVELTAETDGIYYLLPTETPVHEAEVESTGLNGLTPVQIALIALGSVVVLGSAGVGGFVFLKKKKK